jgi:GTP-binding protein Era
VGFKCGFVGLVGPTNSGKSTLINALVGEKLSIVSPRPQTTYHALRGIVSTPEYQIIFTDTPGFQNHPDAVPRMLNKVADRNAQDCDLLIWVFDASKPRTLIQINRLKEKITKHPAHEKNICVLNKVDVMDKGELLPLIAELSKLNIFAEIIPISARKVDGVDRVFKAILDRIPEGHAFYPLDQRTDRSFSWRAAEMVREKIYRETREEVPYSVYVETEEQTQEEGVAPAKVPTVRVVIHVDSDSRKGILIGKGGLVLKKIGTEARADIEKILGKHICLKLFVHVESDWKNNANKLQQYLELQ